MKCWACASEWADVTTICPVCSTDVALEQGGPKQDAVSGRERPVDPPSKRQEPSAAENDRLRRDEARFPPAKILAGRYRVITRLGRGGMGEVYRAEDLTLGETVALKFLPKAVEQNKRKVEQLLSEVKLARKISHPNVCRVHDVGEAEGIHFISMEYVEGEDLASLLRRIGRLPKAKAIDIGLELCSGLDAVHQRRILHHDLKPANVMIDGAGRVRLSDFGLAGFVGAWGGVRGGTPSYMAPELRAGQETSIRSDLYALGLVLYEVFTGHRALRDTERLIRPPSNLVEGFDPAVEKVILDCLERNPAKRPASAQVVAAALSNVDSAVAPLNGGEPTAEGVTLRTLLLSDLVGSTRLVEELGDIASADLFRLHDRLARDLLDVHRGREIDRSDGFLMLFERPIEAVLYALDYHRGLRKLAREQDCAIEARVGVHLAEVVLRENSPEDVKRGAKQLEVEGLAKPTAARLMSLAEGGQTLLTRGAFDVARRAAVSVDDAEQLCWLAHGVYHFKGVSEPVEVCEVGREGLAPLAPPADSEKVRQAIGQPALTGWRPAAGLSIPHRSHWRIESRLGEGGFGEVWLAVHQKTGERRVFKFCYDAISLRGLQREITLFRLLKSELGERDDITRVLDWSFDEAPYFVESEYTEGGNLFDWAEEQGGLTEVPLGVRLEIVAQMATALAAAHSVGVLHKDVKPSNVLIGVAKDGEPQAQLADFGVGAVTEAKRLADAGITALGLTAPSEARSMSASYSGTRLYTAPEVLEGKPATLQADIYALGLMLYQVVVGDLSRALAPGWRRDVAEELLCEDIAAAVDGSPERRLGNALRLAERLRALESRRRKRLAERRQKVEAAKLRAALERTRKRRRVWAVAVVVLTLFGSAMTTMVFRVRSEAEKARNLTRAAVAANLLTGGQTAEGNLLLLEVRRPGETATALDSLHQALANPVEAVILESHTDEVVAAAWSADVERVVTASWDDTARLWDAVTGDTLAVLKGHTDDLKAVAWSGDGRRIATASYDHTARIWDPAGGEQIAVLEDHTAPVSAVAWSRDSVRLATASWDKTVRVWDGATGEAVAVLPLGEGVVDEPFREYLTVAWSGDGRLATNLDTTVRVWEPTAGRDPVVLKGHTDNVLAVAWCSTATRLATAAADTTVRTWDSATGSVLARMEGHTDWVMDVAWSSDGNRLATASLDGTARIWNAADGEQTALLRGHEESLWSVAWSPYGRWVVTSSNDQTVRLWRPEGGDAVAVLAGHGGQITGASWDLEGERLLTVSADRTARIWRPLQIGEELKILRGHSDEVYSASWSGNGRRVVTASLDATARIWDWAGGEETVILAGHEDGVWRASWSGDGQRIATASRDHTARIWDAATGEAQAVLDHTARVWDVRWSPNSKRIATALWGSTAAIWDATSGEFLLNLPHEQDVTTVAWHPSGDAVVTASLDGKARIWAAHKSPSQTGPTQPLTVLDGHTDGVNGALWSPDGGELLTVSSDRTGRVWAAETGETTAVLEGHTGDVRAGAWSPNGRLLLTGAWDNTARVWDARAGQPVVVLEGHTEGLETVAWSPDGDRAVTAGWDGTARLWHAGTGELIATFEGHRTTVRTVDWSADGRRILTASEDGTARIWAASGSYPDFLRARIRARLRRCPEPAFYPARLGVSEDEGHRRSEACEACVPRFVERLGEASPWEWQAYEEAGKVYEGCFLEHLGN